MIPEPGQMPAGTITGGNPVKRLRGQLRRILHQGGVHVGQIIVAYGGREYRVTETRDAPTRLERELWTPVSGPVEQADQGEAIVRRRGRAPEGV